MREFDWIARYFAPLTAGEGGALGLKDDAAVLPCNEAHDLIVTADAMVSGRHFLESDPPDLVAKKLVRVNLSDLAAMGAAPKYGFLTTHWPLDIAEDWIARFAEGLAADQALFGLSIAGGDTVGTPGPLSLTLTALGEVPKGEALLRSGAKPGDTLYISGMIGDAGLGLRVLTKKLEGLAPDHQAALAGRYHLPQPRLSLGAALRGVATACMDVSDGLAQDAGHIARASGLALNIKIEDVPVSPAAQSALSGDLATRADLITAGDDYELLFAAPALAHEQVMAAAHEAGVPVTAIGTCAEADEPTVSIFDAQGQLVPLKSGGYHHF